MNLMYTYVDFYSKIDLECSQEVEWIDWYQIVMCC